MTDIDHEAAEREAARIVYEYPKLIQPSETVHNFARCYLESRAREARLEALVRDFIALHDADCDPSMTVEAARKELTR